MLSTIITFIVVLVILGVALYLIESYIPMAAPIKTIIRVVVILALILFILYAFGIWDGFRGGRL